MVNLLKNLRPFRNYNFKIQWEIHFLTFFIYWPKLFKKKLEWKYGHSYFKSAFGIDSGLREVLKPKIRVFADFQFDHFPKSIINSESRFEMRMPVKLD